MTIRTIPTTAVVVAALVPFPSLLSGQTTYQIPESLRHLRLPNDPLEWVRDFVWKANNRETRSRPPIAQHIFRVGCVADGGWAADAFAALEREAETDYEVRRAITSAIGRHWSVNVKHGFDRCAVDHPRIEGLLTGYLRTEHEEGRLETGREYDVGLTVLESIHVSDDPDTYALVRRVFHDMKVEDGVRSYAKTALKEMRQRIWGETEAVADSTVRADAGKAGVRLPCGYCTGGGHQGTPPGHTSR